MRDLKNTRFMSGKEDGKHSGDEKSIYRDRNYKCIWNVREQLNSRSFHPFGGFKCICPWDISRVDFFVVVVCSFIH